MKSQKEYELAVGLWQEQNTAASFQHLFRAVELDSENAQAHLMLGNLFLFRRDDERAETHFREALRILKRSPEARNSLGVLYIHQRKYADAVRELREATGDLLNRDPYLAWGNLGWAYYENGQFDQAIDALSQSTRLQPRFCVGRFRLGQAYAAKKDYVRAEEALTAALEIDDPRCRALQEAWQLRGQVRIHLDEREGAIADFERCVELRADGDVGRACRRYLQATH